MTSPTQKFAQKGFSLIEMAVVLMILGTLMSGVLLAVTQTTESNRRSTARTQLRTIEEALYGYAQAYGNLPCPSTVASAGAEDDPAFDGECTEWHGFVPSATLGIAGAVNDDGLLVDPWLNPLRYSVSAFDTASGRAFTNTAGLDLLYNTSLLAAGADMICISDDVNCTGTVLATTVPAVIFSMGADWATTTSADEIDNTDGAINEFNFVSTTYTEDLFDDQLIWLSPYILFNRLIDAGKLP